MKKRWQDYWRRVPRTPADTFRTIMRPHELVRVVVPALVVLLFVGFLGFIITIEISSQPFFCRSCHIMEPYYQAWTESKHKNIPCTDCHMSPGFVGTWRAKLQGISQVAKYFTGTQGTRPWAEIDDASCLRSGCHETRLLKGRVDFNGVHFDHTPHLTLERRGKKLRCTSCHSQIVMGEHISVTTSTCILCHFKNRPVGNPVGGCTGCHAVPTKPITLPGGRIYIHADVVGRGVPCVSCHATVTQGDGFVPRSRCYVCHNFPIKNDMLQDHETLHHRHVTEHKVECTNCHEEITHGYESQRRVAQVDCRACHVGMHAAEIALAEGTASSVLGETAPRVGPMLAARVECLGCHIEVTNNNGKDTYEGSTRHGQNQACINCHGNMVRNLLPTWKTFFATRISEVERAIASSRADVATKARARDMLERVRHGRAVHNPTLARDLLAQAELLARGSRNMFPPLAPDSAVSSSGLDCRFCHMQPPQGALRFDGATFLHAPHVERLGLPCVKCHDAVSATFPKGAHGRVHLTKQDCITCHHWQQQNCGACHGSGPSGTIRFRGIAFPHVRHTTTARVECRTCHMRQVGGQRQLTAISLESCATCHHKQTEHCLGCHASGPAQPVTWNGIVFPHAKHPLLCSKCHSNPARGAAVINAAACKGCHHKAAPPVPCARCHGATLPEFVTFRNARLPHKVHVQGVGLECLDCHSPTGARMGVQPVCNTCHHADGMQPACQACHGDGPSGTVPTAWKPFPHSVHIPMGMACLDCHTKDDPTKVIPPCATCHDEAKAAMPPPEGAGQ